MHSTPRVAAQQLVRLAHLFLRLRRAYPAHEAHRLAVLDVERFHELVRVGVLLQIEERVVHQRLEVRRVAFQRAPDDEERGRHVQPVVQRPRRARGNRRSRSLLPATPHRSQSTLCLARSLSSRVFCRSTRSIGFHSCEGVRLGGGTTFARVGMQWIPALAGMTSGEATNFLNVDLLNFESLDLSFTPSRRPPLARPPDSAGRRGTGSAWAA